MLTLVGGGNNFLTNRNLGTKRAVSEQETMFQSETEKREIQNDGLGLDSDNNAVVSGGSSSGASGEKPVYSSESSAEVSESSHEKGSSAALDKR